MKSYRGYCPNCGAMLKPRILDGKKGKIPCLKCSMEIAYSTDAPNVLSLTAIYPWPKPPDENEE